MRAPDSAAGKRVKCPQCATLLPVPRPAAAAASAKPASGSPRNAPTKSGAAKPRQAVAAGAGAGRATASPRAASAAPNRVRAASASTVAPASGGFVGFDGFDTEDLLTASDFDVQSLGPGRRVAAPSTEIPQAEKKRKRNKAFYWAPGVSAIVAAGLNILIFLGCLGFLIWAMVTLMQAEVAGAGFLMFPIIRLCIFGFFVAGGNAHAIVAGLNLVTMRGRTASAVAIGELFFTPIAFAVFFFFRVGWVAAAIFGIGMALYNWPIAGWVALAISGKQAKIDFDEFDDGELDQLAEELQKRAIAKSGH